VFLAKTVETGIVFAPLISGMFVASLQSFAAGAEPSEEGLAVVHQNDVKKMQVALHDRDTIARRSTVSSVCAPGLAFADFREPRICQ
jgi:hypothetical protein